MSNGTVELVDGYDLPVYGVASHTFYYIHIPALICIFASLGCAIVAITMSFRRKSYRTFFTSWTKSERFIVYLAICDGGFNLFHSVDHLHMVIIKDHVRPPGLCAFYGFILAEFIMAQNLMVNIVAINAFLMMYFNKNLNFGRHDWKLLLWMFGLPFVGATIAVSLGTFGTSGSFCFFDGVKGGLAMFLFTTVPLSIIIIMNIIMYMLTWKRIREKTKHLALGETHSSAESSHHRAASTMSMFVLAFFIQWSSLAVFGVWVFVANYVPQVMHHIVTIFTNLGGVLNLIVYLIMIRRHRHDGSAEGRKYGGCPNKVGHTEMKGSTGDSGHHTLTGTGQASSGEESV